MMVVIKVMGVPVVMAELMPVFIAMFVIVTVPLTHLSPLFRGVARRTGGKATI